VIPCITGGFGISQYRMRRVVTTSVTHLDQLRHAQAICAVIAPAAMSEGKFIDCDEDETAGLLLNFSDISRVSAQAAQFGDTELALRVSQRQSD
jgi:hypothetical protein